MKVKSQQGPKEGTFRLRFHEDVVKCRGNSLNAQRNNLLDSLLGFFATHLSEPGGCLKLDIRNLFGSLALAFCRFQRSRLGRLDSRGSALVNN
jgi:hypothetical protein